MKTLKITINGFEVKLELKKDGNCIPFANGIFSAIGLPNMVVELESVFELLFSEQYAEISRLVAYTEDCSIKTANEKLVRYILTDLGCRLTWGTNEEQKHVQVVFAASYLKGFLGVQLTCKEIIALVNEQGFNIQFIESVV